MTADERRILILDNYDSFVYNLYQRIGELTGERAHVVRNDRISLDDVAAYDPTHIVISPGPGSPADPEYFGVCHQVIREWGPRCPILGVCLGHQGIASAYGGRIINAVRVMHGKTSLVDHDGSGVLAGVPSPFVAMRYHSLVVDPTALPSCLRVCATTVSGTIMALQHERYPTFGVQFHPESVGTPHGVRLLSNFLGMSDARRAMTLIERVDVGIGAARTALPSVRRAVVPSRTSASR